MGDLQPEIWKCGPRLVDERREARERGSGPIAAVRWGSATEDTLACTIFGARLVEVGAREALTAQQGPSSELDGIQAKADRASCRF